jgi:hypothetical protein
MPRGKRGNLSGEPTREFLTDPREILRSASPPAEAGGLP